MGCQASNTVTNAQTPRKRLSRVNNADVIATIKRASVNSMYVQEVQKNGQQPTVVPRNGMNFKNGEDQYNDQVEKSQTNSLTESQESNPHSQSQSHPQRPNQSNSLHTSSPSPRSSQPAYPSRQKFTQITITINKPHKNKRQKQTNSQKNSHSSSSPSSSQRKIPIGNTNDELKQNYYNNSSSHLMDVSNSYASSKQVSNSSLSMSLARFNSERML